MDTRPDVYELIDGGMCNRHELERLYILTFMSLLMAVRHEQVVYLSRMTELY